METKEEIMDAGIDAIGFYSSHYYLTLDALAQNRGLEAGHFIRSIGQEKMAVPPPDEDVITLAANDVAELFNSPMVGLNMMLSGRLKVEGKVTLATHLLKVIRPPSQRNR